MDSCYHDLLNYEREEKKLLELESSYQIQLEVLFERIKQDVEKLRTEFLPLIGLENAHRAEYDTFLGGL